MIELHLAIYRDDIQLFNFDTKSDLIDYIKELKMFDCIWLATDSNLKEEIMITESLSRITNGIENNHWRLTDGSKFFVQEYQSYEDAYRIGLQMMERNPKCYSKQDE